MADSVSPDDPFLTTAEVAFICRTSPSTIRYWRYKGYGPPGVRAGRRVLYQQSQVALWLAQQAEVGAGS